jgi:hypothetical protein
LGFLKEMPSVLLFLTNRFEPVYRLARIDHISVALSLDWRNLVRNVALIFMPSFVTLLRTCHDEVS